MRALVCFLAISILACGASSTRAELSLHERAPAFQALDQHGDSRSLSEFRGKSVVLFFYPRDGTPGCTEEACAFRDAWTRLESLNSVVVGVSRDDVESHRQFADEHELSFPLLADDDGRIAEAYGVSEVLGMSARTTFIIDADGVVRRKFVDVDPGVHVEEVMRALRSLVAVRSGNSPAEPDAAPEPSVPTGPDYAGRCSHACCNDAVRELQEQAADDSGDETIRQECCFCD